MAIFHFSMGTVSKDKTSKSRSRSAAKKSRYNDRTGEYAVDDDRDDLSVADQSRYNDRTGQFADRHEGETVIRDWGHMPKWAKANPQEDPQHYWDACDKYERDNGRLARTFIIALPRELTTEQNLDLMRSFVKDLAHDNHGRELPYSFDLHLDKDNHNPHCHVMISERINDQKHRNASTWFKRPDCKNPKERGAGKTDDLKAMRWLYGARERWQEACNQALIAAGSDTRIDCRSLKAQKIDRAPTVHLGLAKHRPMHPVAKERLEHNAAVQKIVREERNIKELQDLLTRHPPEPTKPRARFAVNAHRYVMLDAARQAKRGKNFPIKAPRQIVLPKQFTAQAIMEYMAKIGEELVASVLKTAQMELEHQRRIAAMWQDLNRIATDPIGNGLHTPGGRARGFAPVVQKYAPAPRTPTVADQLSEMTQRAKAAVPPSHVIPQTPRPRW
jgi:hypothetical protein